MLAFHGNKKHRVDVDVDDMQAFDDYHSTNVMTNNSVGITAASLNCGCGRFKYKIVRSAQSGDPHLAALYRHSVHLNTRLTVGNLHNTVSSVLIIHSRELGRGHECLSW